MGLEDALLGQPPQHARGLIPSKTAQVHCVGATDAAVLLHVAPHQLLSLQLVESGLARVLDLPASSRAAVPSTRFMLPIPCFKVQVGEAPSGHSAHFRRAQAASGRAQPSIPTASD